MKNLRENGAQSSSQQRDISTADHNFYKNSLSQFGSGTQIWTSLYSLNADLHEIVFFFYLLLTGRFCRARDFQWAPHPLHKK